MNPTQLTFGVHYNIVTFTHILTKTLLTAAGRKQNITSQCHQADNSMFRKILHNSEHVLYNPPVSNTFQNLRKRAHDRVLPDRLSHLADSNFIICMLLYEAY